MIDKADMELVINELCAYMIESKDFDGEDIALEMIEKYGIFSRWTEMLIKREK